MTRFILTTHSRVSTFQVPTLLDKDVRSIWLFGYHFLNYANRYDLVCTLLQFADLGYQTGDFHMLLNFEARNSKYRELSLELSDVIGI